MPSLRFGALDRRLCSFPFWLRRLWPTCHCSLCGIETTLFFQQARYAQVFPLKLTPSCTLFAGLGNTNKSAISLLFSSYLTLALSSPPCSLLDLSFYFNLCPKLFSLFSSSIRLQWVPGHSFLLDDDAANILSHLNSSTHMLPRFPPSNFASTSCSLCSLSPLLQRTQPSAKLLSP